MTLAWTIYLSFIGVAVMLMLPAANAARKLGLRMHYDTTHDSPN